MKSFRSPLFQSVMAAAVLAALVWAGPAAAQVEKPHGLYLLSVGISQYQSAGMNLQSAAKDAADVAETFRAQKGKLFKEVEVRTLINSEATAAKITDALKQLRTKTNPYSYVIVYLAGHGDCGHDGEFFFDGYDFNNGQKDKTSVSWRQIQQALSRMPGKVILILDSCRSGAVGANSDIIVLSAAMAHQNAGESNANGYFTQALLEGLRGRADLNRNGVVTLAELNLYVSERLEQLSFGKQQAATVMPPNTPNALPLSNVSPADSAVVAVQAPKTQPVVSHYPPTPASTGPQSPTTQAPDTIQSSGPLERPLRGW